MTGICSKALSTSLNPNAVSYGYQGAFAEEINDFDLNYNEFELRNFDPQTARWTGVDPYDEFPSPYTGMGNDPANNVDEDGGFSGGLGAVIGAASGFAIGTGIAKLSGADWDEALLYGAGGALLDAGIGYGIGQSQIDHTGLAKISGLFMKASLILKDMYTTQRVIMLPILTSGVVLVLYLKMFHYKNSKVLGQDLSKQE
jgi:RHS repeat-associated protein